MTADEPTVIDDFSDLVRVRSDIQLLCDRGYVCDITLRDGTMVVGVFLGVSSSALILDGWDADHHIPAADPFVLELSVINRIVVP